MMHFHIITLFPESFHSYLGESILKRAIENKKIRVSFYNPKDFEKPLKGKALAPRIDDRPYGGGPGMVMRAEPVVRAIESAVGRKKKTDILFVWFTPHGEQLTNKYAEEVSASYRHIVLICGRYEGIDARVREVFSAHEVSVGPFTLTGGELPAMIFVDAVSRRISGVLGSEESVEERRVAGKDAYTRPEVFTHKGVAYAVPEVLLSGNHQNIEKWRKSQQ